jgi:branched-chain amino acid aminotransferase
LLNDRGDVAEGTGENIFFVKGGRLHTNDTSADTLAGITQATVLTLARDARIDVTVDRITLDDLYAADEIFFTGTAAEVMPIGAIDDRRFAGPRPITDALARAYRSAVLGTDPRHPDWVEYQ